MVRYTVHFQGHVQGVGFRYTTRTIARNFHVAGFVKNLPDGRVQLVAEGDKAELDRFLEQIDKQMSEHIQNRDVMQSDATGEFGDPSPGALGIAF